MRWLPVTLFLTVQLFGQQSTPIGLVHGKLLEIDTAGSPGTFTIRTTDNHVYRFLFDSMTYFEKENELSSPAHLEKDDWLEIVSDRWQGGTQLYARTVHVIEQSAPRHVPPSIARMHTYRSIMNSRPRGDLTFSGVVARLNGAHLVLHTHDGERTFLLRMDTRYISEGHSVDQTALTPNTRVFVRAGKNVDGQIEAYQIVWGEILEP